MDSPQSFEAPQRRTWVYVAQAALAAIILAAFYFQVLRPTMAGDEPADGELLSDAPENEARPAVEDSPPAPPTDAPAPQSMAVAPQAVAATPPPAAEVSAPVTKTPPPVADTPAPETPAPPPVPAAPDAAAVLGDPEALADAAASMDERRRAAQANRPQTQTLDRPPHAPPAAGVVPSFGVKELGNFTYDETRPGDVPADVLALAGTPVSVTGYMLPIRQTTRITEFLLVDDVAECCFGEPPGLEHLVRVRLPEGKAVPYTFAQIAVTGDLAVEPEVEGGYVVNLMGLENVTSVRTTGGGGSAAPPGM